MLAIGAIAGAVFLLVVFGLLIPPDRGEESAIVLMPFVGGFFGLITALVSSAVSTWGCFCGRADLTGLSTVARGSVRPVRLSAP